MPLTFDTNETIKKSVINLKLGRLMRMATFNSNRSFEVILKKSGLSRYIEKFRQNLEPFSYNYSNNKTYENTNHLYSPESVFDYFYDEIGQNDREHQFLFLKAIVEEIKNMDFEELEYFNLYLISLGYSIFQVYDDPIVMYSLQQIDISVADDCGNITRFEEECEKMKPGSFECFKEALSTFRNSDFSSCISNCRKLLEDIVCNVTGLSRAGNAIFKLSKEEFEDDGGVHDLNQAIKYWAEKRIKVCRFMRLFTLYNFECNFGSHHNDKANYEDALLILRETQSTIHWIYANK